MSSINYTIQLGDKKISAKEGDNLLETLLTNNIDVHYGCRAGVCGACRLYDVNNQQTLLCCQVNVASPMIISTQIPSSSVSFALEDSRILNDSTIELTLLGPSDDSFGDRVTLFLGNDKEPISYDCMAVNSAGEPLKVLVQKSLITDFQREEVWQKKLPLTQNDKIQVSTVAGVRKGRLLYEMGLDNVPTIVVSTFENRFFKSYWQEALDCLSSTLIDFYSLPATSHSGNVDRQLTAFLEAKMKGVEQSNVQIIYHGQKLSQQKWQTILRPLRIRLSQLHFVR